MKIVPTRTNNGLSDKVYRSLYNRIVTGRLKPGQRITEMQIAKSKGVSQAPVREALKRLAEDRLVDLVPRSGCYVCELTREDVDYLFEIRKRLESLALEYAFENLDPKRVQNLRQKFNECRELGKHKLVQKELKLDSLLHSMIFEASGSKDLQVLLNKLWARIQLFRIREATDLARARLALKRHIEILDSILARDMKKAQGLLLQHLEESQQNILEHFV